MGVSLGGGDVEIGEDSRAGEIEVEVAAVVLFPSENIGGFGRVACTYCHEAYVEAHVGIKIGIDMQYVARLF